MRTSISIVSLAYSGVALASLVAVRSFSGALDEMKEVGDGIAAITLGAGEAARFPLAAAWIAAVATAVAIVSGLLAVRRSVAGEDAAVKVPPQLLWSTGLSLVLSIASVLLFRGVIEYVLAVAVPGAQPPSVDATNMAAVASRITFASIAIAVCFGVAAVMSIRQARLPRGPASSRAVLSVTAAALVVSLGVSTVLVITLRSYSRSHLDVALRGAPVSTVLR